jgi:uncharacterized protein
MPRVVHFEFGADDPERLAAFFEKAFGWKVMKWDGPMDYWLVQTGEAPEPGIDGAIARRGEGPGQCHAVGVPDLDEYVGRVQAAGGTVTMPRHAIPGVGWFAVCVDTEGNTFGMMQPDESAG